ncbi:hypothetical protein K6L09_15055, partial [Burkholderia cepacia]
TARVQTDCSVINLAVSACPEVQGQLHDPSRNLTGTYFAVFSAFSTFSCKYPLVPGGKYAYSGTRSLIVSHAPAG